MKYVIHTYPKRMWYVDKYLIPSMTEQGIDRNDIYIWNDDKGYGNLTSWVKSCEWCIETFDPYECIWHMQDDVVIAKDFYERSKKLSQENPNTIICGFFEKSTLKQQPHKFEGIRTPKDMCNSFQCVHIPNYLMYRFPSWFNRNVNGKYYLITKKGDVRCGATGITYPRLKYAKLNKNDDAVFAKYLREEHKYNSVICLLNPLVQHVDYLLGGSLLYNRKSVYETINFDNSIVEELKEKLKNESIYND